jgi:hypothetical protein
VLVAVACAAEPDPGEGEPGKGDQASSDLLGGVKFETCAPADAIATIDNYSTIRDAHKKLDFHLGWMKCTEYSKLPRLSDAGNSLSAVVQSLLSLTQKTTLDPGRAFEPIVPVANDPGDLLPTGREKFIHTVGSAAKVTFKRDPSRDTSPECSEPAVKYTGVVGELASGATIPAVVRLAWAGDPRLTFVPLLIREFRLGFLPGLGLKFFLEGDARSVNVLAFSGVEGALEEEVPNASNFFAGAPTTSVATPQRSIGMLLAEFLTVIGKADNALHLSVEELATWKADGTREPSVVHPDRLTFVGASEAIAAFASPSQDDDFRNASCHRYLTTMVLDGELAASAWSDFGLYFRHPVEGQR